MVLPCLQKPGESSPSQVSRLPPSLLPDGAPTSPRPPRPTSFFFMAEGPTDVSWGIVVPARLISWLVGWLTLYLENDVMWIRTLMLFSEKLYTCLREDPCLYGATLAMAFVSASKSRRTTSNPGRQASTQLIPQRARSTQQCCVARHSCITVIPAGRQSLSVDEKQIVYQDHFEFQAWSPASLHMWIKKTNTEIVIYSMPAALKKIKHSVVVQWLSFVWLFVTPWTAANQAPLSVGFPRWEQWRGLPLPFPGDLLDSGVKPTSPALQEDSLMLIHGRSL